MTASGCKDREHVFEPGLAVEQWIAVGRRDGVPASAVHCVCGELAIQQLESSRDAHWPLWPFYVGHGVTVTDTRLLSAALRATIRCALAVMTSPVLTAAPTAAVLT